MLGAIHAIAQRVEQQQTASEQSPAQGVTERVRVLPVAIELLRTADQALAESEPPIEASPCSTHSLAYGSRLVTSVVAALSHCRPPSACWCNAWWTQCACCTMLSVSCASALRCVTMP